MHGCGIYKRVGILQKGDVMERGSDKKIEGMGKQHNDGTYTQIA